MTLHLLRLAVGIAAIDDLATAQEAWSIRLGEPGVAFGYTKRKPRRVAELLDGGSLYWVIRGQIAVRQRLLDLADSVGDDGEPFCLMRLDPRLVPVVPAAHRPFQGWRYLDPADAPPDLGIGDDADLPPELARDLRQIGVL